VTLPPPSTNDGLDRVAPSRRPAGRCLLRMRWAHLLFLHWAVPPEPLRPLIPKGLDLDLFAGRAYVGLVPFTMTGVRPWCAPAVRRLSNFHEVNVRTYVHLGGRDPGVWFFSLDAANRVAVTLARWSYHLPYYHSRIRLVAEGWPDRAATADAVWPGPAPRIDYASERIGSGPKPAGCAVRYGPKGEPAPAKLGTLDHFLVERYLLYAESRGRIYQGRVHHAPYLLQTAEVPSWSESLLAAAGIARPAGEPLAHYVRAVTVEVFAPERVETRRETS
jgi:uncharacterized protein YqjF (DUF2071 family)